MKPSQSNLKRGLLRHLGLVVIAFLGLGARGYSQCASPANAIVAENCLTGNDSSDWDINGQGTGDLTIQGFATDISVNQGGTVYFKINTPASRYTIDIYRMGYYGGMGARKITSITPSAALPQTQPTCLSDTTTGLTDCGNWGISASWQVPAAATSGIYFAHLTRTDTGGDSHIVFVVRNDSSKSDVFYQTSDPTWEAYNYFGNGSLYGGAQPVFGLSSRTFAVSYNRPFLTRGFASESATWVFGAEFAMVQWLESNGYDVSYTTGLDSARNGTLIQNHKVFMDSGHDEYVSAQARSNIQAARDAGVNLAFFSGNEFFWKTRWVNSIDGTNTPYRTIVCYKETLAFAKLDPADPPTWTGTWRDPTFSPPADGGFPENALTGTLFKVNGPGTDNAGDLTIKVPQADGQMRFWRNTAVANLAAGKSYTLVPGSLGYEWDVDSDNGFRPAGAFHLSTSTYPLTEDLLLDYGGTYGAGTATHNMMMYRAPSGALVFGAGTVDWAYGLNSNHDSPFEDSPAPDVNMQQATVNLFADMGAQPATIQHGLTAATKSTDTVPPQSVITSPAVGATVNTGTTVNVTGTAVDTAGVVAGVEFSGDGGVTWHPAIGRGTWTYTWTPTIAGQITILSRAVDDSGNLETTNSGVAINSSPQNCPCTIFGSNSPAAADSGDGAAIEVGVKFRADSDGSLVGVRFYKSTANTGTHIGHIWSDSGQLLGAATFTAESASGWQQVNFSTPIPATANTTYIASYFAPSGHYAADSFFFEQAGTDDPPLHALANGVDGGDGVYVYNAAGGFPTSTFNATNYWADVIFVSSNTYGITGTISGVGGSGATVTLTGAESLSTVADASGNYVFSGVVNGSYNVSVSNLGVTFAPPSQAAIVSFGSASNVNFVATVSNPLSISGTISGGAGATVTLGGTATLTTTADSSGNYAFIGLLNGAYTVTPAEPTFIFLPSTQSVSLLGSNATSVNFQGQVCNCISIWQPSDSPAVIDSGDGAAVELGVRITADSPAYLTGLRFYKSSTNIGTHVGHLWSNSGQLLGTATFPGETASGWQQGYFASPVLINAGTPYVASYFAPQGHYSLSTGYFASSGKDQPPLHALQDGVSGGDGIYLYSSSGGFPSGSYNSTNYWVDVLYAAQPHNISGTISGTGGAGATVNLSGPAQVTTTADANGNFTFAGILAGAYTVTPSSNGYVFVPGYQSLSVSQADITGINFTVPQMCPCETVWPTSVVPALIDAGDAQSIELGVKVRTDSDGYILGVRFYKAATNTGVHIGNLWSGDSSGSGSGGETVSGSGPGGLLATATFTNEAASGWQQVMFANPVPVVANATYIASYFAPMGHYSADSAFFTSSGVDSPPLHALQSGVDGQNGVFSYSATSALPTMSFNGDNYWVDVIYAATAAHTIAGNVSGPGAAGATITLSGTSAATTITDANGSFSFNGIANGSYTVAASEAGFQFSPSSQPVVINGAHNLGVNFVSSVLGYAVSGTVTGAPGIPVALVGNTTQTTTADASGNFSFMTVPNGTYTVTPASGGFTVTPASQSISVTGAPVSGLNFSATVNLFSISGNIASGAGVTVSLSGSTAATATADASGNYSFAGLTVGNYTVTPSIAPGIVFNPGSLAVIITGANITAANFALPQNCPCDTIWPSSAMPTAVDGGNTNSVEVGVKFRADADAYITGLRFYKAVANTGTHVGHIWSSSGTLLGTATFANESSSGWQQVFFSSPVPVTANTTYVASYFAPVGHNSADLLYFANSATDAPPLHALMDGFDGSNGVYLLSSTGGFPSTASQSNAINYWVDVIYTPTSTYSIAGTITGAGGPAATVSLGGASTATTIADVSGNFEFDGLANGSYSVAAAQSGFSYTPAAQNAVISSGHALGLSFSSAAGIYTISGTITGPGGAGATVSLSGASTVTVMANSSGAFSFPGLGNGSYVVSVGNTGFMFTPPSQAISVSGANALANFSSVAQTYSLSGAISGPGASGATLTLSGASTATAIASSAGAFSFAGLVNGSFTVTASKAGFAFTPPSQTVVVSGANASANFSSAVQTYSISGTISGPGGSGATISLTGAATATTTANTSGTFSFVGLSNGTYAVAVSNVGFVFTPASQAVSVSGANASVTVSSVVQTFKLTGTISGTGGNGALITVSGTSNATTTANASGVYTFAALPQGSYTVTPSKTGYIYTPASQMVTLTANSTANFTSVATYSISGTISGAGGSGATISVTGTTTATVTANTSGAYTIAGLPKGTYTVTPSKAGGFTFTPAIRSVTINAANVTANFTSVQVFTITGTISGGGGNAATVKLSGAAAATTTTNASGVYTFTGLAKGSYTVTASKTGFVFTPSSQAITLTTANGTANFSSAVQTFSITGTISGAGGSAATVSLTGAATASITASSSGAYSFTGLGAGSYTVTPTKAGYIYTPASRAVTLTTASTTANFNSAAQTYMLSGTITGTGNNGATVKLTGAANASITTNSSGAYSFTGLANGAYAVTASKTGYVYTPASQAVTVSGANVTANFSSAILTYSISGTISGAGGSGATVKLTGSATATTTANTSGVYTFTGLSKGIYVVTPNRTGHTYSPASQMTFVFSSNVTGLNFTSK